MNSIFFEHIDEMKVNVNSRHATIFVRDKHLNGNSVNQIAGKMKYLIYNFKEELIIKINIKSSYISDMSTIAVLEYIIFYSLVSSKHNIYISFNPNRTNYFSNYLESSLIGNYIRSNKSNCVARKTFIEMFKSSKTFITPTHYRKLINNDADKKHYLNILYTELSSFIKQSVYEHKYKENYCEAIIELVTNVLDHTDGDCIVSIERGEAIYNKKGTEHDMLSIVISNVSHNLFYDNLKEQHQSKSKDFPLIDTALENHKKQITALDCDYDINKFYIVSAFQNKISTRIDQKDSGGTGLLKTINNILGRTSDDVCYLLSGDEVLYFKEDKIMPNDGYIGFNTEHNYINMVPDEDMFDKSGMYFNGTMINLMLFFKKEED